MFACMPTSTVDSLMERRAPFDGFVEKAVRATSTCLIMADHNRYSVDAAPPGGL